MRLKVSWFRQWHSDLDAALSSLPELELFPHAGYRTLLEAPAPLQKRTALVTRAGEPVALIPLRRRTRFTWEPALQWLLPGSTFPALPGCAIPALRALSITVNVGFWRCSAPTAEGRDVRHREVMPTHRLRLSPGYEDYWRETRYWKTIGQMRRRFADLRFAINEPGSAEWVLRNWSRRWNPEAGADPVLADRILVAAELEARGLHRTIRFYDGETPVGGETAFLHGSDVAAGVLYCLPEYWKKGLSVRLIDQSIQCAADDGFTSFDIGGGHDYKAKWAPQEGTRTTLVISPDLAWGVRRTVAALRGKLHTAAGAPAAAAAGGD